MGELMTSVDITLWSILGFIVIAVIWAATTFNRMVRSRNRTKEGWSGIDIQLKRRASLIVNLVETVKGYAAHEREVFEEVTRNRSALQQAGGAAEAASANNALTQALGRLFAVAENYPQLRASENFMALQKELSDIEEKIAYARQFYNRNVLDFNTRIQVFPGVLIAQIFTFEPADFFEVEEEVREDVRVSFVSSAAPGSPDPPPAS
jgi:LemA protein